MLREKFELLVGELHERLQQSASSSVAAAAVGHPPSPKVVPPPFSSTEAPTFAPPPTWERKPPLEEEAVKIESSDEESMRRGVGGNSSTDPMSQGLEIRTARCEEDSTDRMLQELETVTARWDEDSIVAKCGDRFEKKHGVRFTPLEDLLADKIKTLRKDLKDVRAASPKTKRARLPILAMVKDEVEDSMLSSGDESA